MPRLHRLCELLSEFFMGDYDLQCVVVGEVPESGERFTVTRNITNQALYSLTDLDLGTRELQRLNGKRREQIVEQREAYRQVFESVLKRGIAEGIFGTCDPKLTTFAVLGLLNSVVNWFSAAGPKSIDELADDFTRLVLGGLLANSPRATALDAARR